MTAIAGQRLPRFEVERLLRELDEQLRIVFSPEAFGGHGGNFFFGLLRDQADIGQAMDEIVQGLRGNAELNGRSDYLAAVLSACAHCVGATRLEPDKAWPAVLDAQRHAGAATAILVAGMERKHADRVTAKHAKDLQTAANDQIREFLFSRASRSKFATVSAAAKSVAKLFDADSGSRTLAEFGSTLKLDRLATTFQEFIRADMERLGVRSVNEKITQAENRVRFAQWKKLYASQASGSTPGEI